jgi:hypothetical protein
VNEIEPDWDLVCRDDRIESHMRPTRYPFRSEAQFGVLVFAVASDRCSVLGQRYEHAPDSLRGTC